jgi:hypothetical protein
MGKSTNFSGQPILNQLLFFSDEVKIRRISMKHQSDRYVKKFSTSNHVMVMLFVALECYSSIREVDLGLLANAPFPPGLILHSKAQHLFRSE